MKEKKIWLIIIISCIVAGFLDYKFWAHAWQIAVERWLFALFIFLPSLVIYPVIKEEIYKIFLGYWKAIMIVFWMIIYLGPRYSTRKIIFLLVMILIESIIFSIYLLRLKIKKKG